ncbi:hypothetical protein AAFF_G00339470 [Aldrovandia affinis]|uniref:Fibronectin type-III domain-containing protein n=1 Tax=Aldrovandia affinis TaxID=143900 RepID=A0AAD7WQ20_9TELE|nr:hypothetical protein AAFF_G00339470 [Aldrovandia affinis]
MDNWATPPPLETKQNRRINVDLFCGATKKMTKVKSILLRGFLTCLCFQTTFFAKSVRDLETKVALLTAVEREDPKCFAEGMMDLTCFWEEDGHSTPGQYTFLYKYQNDNNSACAVAAQPAGGNRTRYICKLSTVKHFVPLDLTVFRNGALLHNRSLSIDLVFLLNPPENLTVTRMGKPGQLRLSWLPPSLKRMTNSMVYEVSYTLAGSQTGKLAVVRGNTESVLRSLHTGTRYDVQVRAKPDGLTYNGYWSAWTPTVSMETPPNDFDPLIICLCLIISLILTLLALAAFLSRRRFLLKKMWPLIPSPENQFPGLFTVYEGNFLEWLGQSSGGLWRRPSLFHTEEIPTLLEVLTEAGNEPLALAFPTPSRASAPLREASEEEEKEEEVEGAGKALDSGLARDRWLIDQLRILRGQPVPSPWPRTSLLESKDAYITLNQSSQPDSGERTPPPLPDDISEESSRLRSLAASGTSANCSDLGSLRQNSGSDRLSSQSSFEYPHNSWLPKGPGYPYLAVADSGISMDYSPMSSSRSGPRAGILYTNDYKNDIPQQRQRPSGQPIPNGR